MRVLWWLLRDGCNYADVHFAASRLQAASLPSLSTKGRGEGWREGQKEGRGGGGGGGG